VQQRHVRVDGPITFDLVAVWNSMPNNTLLFLQSLVIYLKLVWISSELIKNLNLIFVPTFTVIGSRSINSISCV